MSQFEPYSDKRAAEVIAEFSHGEGPLLPMLHALQEVFGCVPEKVQPMIAEALNISRAEVHGVVTFYHDFRREPHGKHVLKICRAESCQACGCDPLIERAEQKLGVKMGETSKDKGVTLEAVYCLGLCMMSPAAMLDGKVVGRLDEKRMDALLKEAQA